MKVNAYHNGDDVFIAWKPDDFIADCRGFALLRKRNGVEETVSTSNNIEFELGFSSKRTGLRIPAGLTLPRDILPGQDGGLGTVEGWCNLGLLSTTGEPIGEVFVQSVYLARVRKFMTISILEREPGSCSRKILEHRKTVCQVREQASLFIR